MSSTKLLRCPICHKGQLFPSVIQREFRPRGLLVQVELLTSYCDYCGMKTTRAKQHDENLRRLADRKHHNAYKGLLLGEEILKLRHRYGLTRKAAARIFGKSNSTFARYEHELSYPNESMTMLLRMSIEKPETLQWLAAQVNENIPLWTERYEDQSKV